MEYATSRITGPALFTSAVMTAPGGSGYTAVKISTGNIALDTGKRYVMFFTTSTQGAQPNGSYQWGSVNGTTYAGGDFVFKNNGTNFNQLSTSNWSIFGALDLAFNAEFGFANFIALAHTNNQLSVATALQAVAEGTPKGTAGTIINILSGLDPAATAAAFDAVSGEGTTGRRTRAVARQSSFDQLRKPMQGENCRLMQRWDSRLLVSA